MPSMTESPDTDRTGQIIRRMSDEIHEWVSRSPVAHADRPAGIVRLRVDVPSVDPIAWLHQQRSDLRIYWASRDKDVEVAAWGAAHAVNGAVNSDFHSVLDVVQGILSRTENDAKYYGGFRFYAEDHEGGAWDKFGGHLFVLPRFELVRTHEGCSVYCNLFEDAAASGYEHILRDLQALSFEDAELDQVLPIPISRLDQPEQTGWHSNVDSALRSFDRGELEKIVLARKSSFQFRASVDPFVLLQRLHTYTSGCFHFCFQLDTATAFIGASPERLFRRDGREFRSESVAGTRPRGATGEEDKRLGRELLESDKDLREHYFVRDSIRDRLNDLCASLEIDEEVSLLQLPRGQHLFTGISGTLHPTVSDADLLDALHPTPAVGGCPTGAALKKIVELEGFDRGWYAAPVGWVGADAAEFAVAIRSGLIEGKQLSLFSGAGIVKGSTPEEEWNEIENKISGFIKVLTGT